MHHQATFLIVIAIPGKPDPVKECAVTNKTYDAISVNCQPGYDGGLQQRFVIEVFPVSAIDATPSTNNNEINNKNNLEDGMKTSASLISPLKKLQNPHFPSFSVEGLQPGTAFGMVVYAQNDKVIVKSLASLMSLIVGKCGVPGTTIMGLLPTFSGAWEEESCSKLAQFNLRPTFVPSSLLLLTFSLEAKKDGKGSNKGGEPSD